MDLFEPIILSVLAASTPLLIAATGELVTERSGVLNLGVEGMMIVGAACAFGGTWLTGSIVVGAIITLLVVAAAAVLLGRTIKGFEIRVVGAAPRAARFGGFNANQLILLTFAVSGALAGLAGIIEVAGPVGHLQPGISPGYGFTAIIVAFLGRLNPIGILIAGLFLALTFIGGEQAQIAMKIPLDVTKVFQGILLFYVLACDSLILHRVCLIATPGKPAQGHA